MGKEWHWGGRSSKKARETQTEIPSGCMCAVFQAFDFHPFHFSFNPQQSSFKSRTSEDHTVPRGTFAPLNSTLCSRTKSQTHLCSKITTLLQLLYALKSTYLVLYISGAERPRSSLESEDGTTVSSISKEENLKIPVS